MKQGIDCFGKSYGIMYRNDTHAAGSVDRIFYERMIRLDESSACYLYSSFTDIHADYVMGGRPYLEEIASSFNADSDMDKVNSIISFCRNIVANCETDTYDMLFGGTEEEIIARGTYWCTDIARVACILFQIARLPSRILVTANTNFAYCGHSIAEVYYLGKWGAVDPTNGVIIQKEGGIPASAWDVHCDPEIANRAFNEKFPDWQDFFPPGEQYESVGIVNYYVSESDKYDYSISKINAYGAEILRHSDEKWADGLRWICGEDAF